MRRTMMGEEAWLNQRKQVVTATEVGCLFGLNPYKSGASIVREKQEKPKKISNSYMTIGNWLEPVVVEATNLVMNSEFKLLGNGQKAFDTLTSPRLGATPDAADERAFLECKTTRPENLLKWAFSPPPYYLLQLHAQMMCGKKDQGYLACLGTNLTQVSPELILPLIIFNVGRSEEIEELITQEVNRFWQCVEKQEKFRANSQVKKRMSFLLEMNCSKIY